MVSLFYDMARRVVEVESEYESAASHDADEDEAIDLEADSEGERESSGGLLSESSDSAEAPLAPPPVLEAVVRRRGYIHPGPIPSALEPVWISSDSRSRSRSTAGRPVPIVVSSGSPEAAGHVRARSAESRRVSRDGREASVEASRPSTSGKTTMPVRPRDAVLRRRAQLAKDRKEARRVPARGEGMGVASTAMVVEEAGVAADAAAAAADARAAARISRGAPSHRRRAERAAAALSEATDTLRRVRGLREARATAEGVGARLERLEKPEDGPDVPEEEREDAPADEVIGTPNVQDFFTYCKLWLDHERHNKTGHVKILPPGRTVSRMCLRSSDDAAKREKKLADMIGIGVLFVQHCGVLIPDVQDDNTAVTDNLRADLRQYTYATHTSLEGLFAMYRMDRAGKLTLAQCLWMLKQFPSSSALVREAMSRSETDLLLGYRRMITHEQCERLKLDLVEYCQSKGVYTVDVMQDGECPLQENILAIMHRSADAHNSAVLDSCKFTVGDAVWLSLHTNDDDNAKEDPAFKRIMQAVRVHCKYHFDVLKTASKKRHYQNKIDACKTPGQLLRGSTSPLEMSADKYPYHLRPLFPQYEAVEVDAALASAKETSARHELTAPTPRPYEAVLALWYEANCNLDKAGPFVETSGFADVLFPTRRPWKVHPSRGLAIRRAHANALKDRFPDNWYASRDKVPVRVWMHIPLCVSSVFYFKHVHSLLRNARVSIENSPVPVSEEPDFGFPGLPATLDAKNGGFRNPGNACYMNASFQALLRSNIGPRFMRSVQRMARAHLNNLRNYWHTQSTAVKKEMKESTRRLLEGGLKFRHGAMPKLCTYEMLILYVIDAHSKNVRGGVETGSVQHMISNDAVPLSVYETTALEKKCTAMIGPNYIREVPDDYNCFFSCMAVSQNPEHSAEQVKVRQAQLRQELVAYLRRGMEERTLPGLLPALVTEDWLRTMANDLEMGDDTAMMGMSCMFGRRINVYRPMHGGHLTLLQVYSPEEIRDENVIHIFHTGIHFDVLVPPIVINAKMNMDSENPNQVALYTHMNAERIKQKMLDEKIRGVWNHFIFFAAMYELTETYCETQTQKTVSLTHLYDLLLVHRLKINADRGRHLFDYRQSNDAGEAVFVLCDRFEEFGASIKDTSETLKTLISSQGITEGTCTICSTPTPVKVLLHPITRILVEIPHELDNIARNLQDLTTESEGTNTFTYECLVCENAGTVASLEVEADGKVNKRYNGTRTFSRRHADFTCFQLNWISTLQENGQDQPGHNPNLVNLTIPETIQLVGVDSAEHDYNLIAAVHHVGGCHYKTCVKADGVWMDYNDVTAVACTLEDAVRCTGAQSDPYLLFYEKSTSTRAAPRADTPPTPRAETPPTPPRAEPAAVYVRLPWDGPPEQWAALQARVPSWAEGSTDDQERYAMNPFLAANSNMIVVISTTADATVRLAIVSLLRRLAKLEARRANIIFGAKQIERLTKHRESTVTSGVVLSQQEILTLMSCALFDLFPYSAGKEHEHIGLTRIFRFASTMAETWGVEKTRCILNYLRMTEADRGGTRVVRFKRHVASFPEAHWLASTMPMKRCTWHDVDAASGAVVKIEDVCDKLDGQAWEVDFANRDIGGGVTDSGCVQEEIRFMQCPELIVSLLFTDRLDHNESIQITGYRQFNDTRGYGRENAPERFTYVGPHEVPEPAHGRSMLVMDAAYYAEHLAHQQFGWDAIKRELDKARCAFDYSENASWPIVTGHWGCGAFHGNHRLKSFIQLLAAAEAGKRVEFCNFGDRRGAETRAFIESIPADVPVGKLYQRLKQLVYEQEDNETWYRNPQNVQKFFERLTRTRYHSHRGAKAGIHDVSFDVDT